MVRPVMREPLPISPAPVTAVLGPTNTGKTHLAVERMLGHASGMIGLPLRLLAREIYDRVVAEKGAAAVALITGEEKIVPPHPAYYVCTVEAMPLDIAVSFLAIDEIQLAADPERGHVFTHRLLQAHGRAETMLLGAESMRAILKQLLPQARFLSRPRFSDLTYAGPKKISRLPRRSAIVAFSAEQVYAIAELIRRQRGGAAVVMGALSPRTRNAQVALYQAGDVDFLVATDAIGMGLNMDIDHVAFASLSKFDGTAMRALKPAETAQIAGRAGRFKRDGTFGTTADAPPMDSDLVERIEAHSFEPVRLLQWRNTALDYSSLPALIASLEQAPSWRGLVRARPAIDLLALQIMARTPDVAAMARAPAAIRRLWDVCQIPDFRKVMTEEHVRLLINVYRQLMSDRGQIASDWIAASIDPLKHTNGDIDTLATRLAHMRTWTFITNRSGWVADAAHWRAETRAIEDRLSDALHERLTHRFVDRRTSVLMKRLRDEDDLAAHVTREGEVSVEGEYVGRLQGFGFAADPRAQGIHGKALRAAALKALKPEIRRRAARLLRAADDEISLSDTGRIWWQGSAIAQLTQGAHWLRPRVDMLREDDLPADYKRPVLERLERFVTTHIETHLAPIVRLHRHIEDKSQTDLTGMARGIGFQLVEAYGLLERAQVAEQLRALPSPDRQPLRRLGVRFGEFSIFMPKLVKPAAARCLAILWRIDQGKGEGLWCTPPAPGLCSIEHRPDMPSGFVRACGFLPCGRRAVRVDMLERLGLMIRRALASETPTDAPTGETSEGPAGPVENGADLRQTAAPPGEPAAPPPPADSFAVSPDMMSLIGCSGEDFDSLLHNLGFRKSASHPATSGPDGPTFWHRRRTGGPRRNRKRPIVKSRRRSPRRNEKGAAGGKNRAQPPRPPSAPGPSSPFAVLGTLARTAEPAKPGREPKSR